MTTYVYFDNGQAGTPLFNTMNVVSEQSPGAAWSSPVACTVSGVAATSLADPQVNLLPNGQYLLTWSTQSEIDTAVSSDAIHFTSEQLAVAAPPNSSVTDPSVVQLPNGMFLMVVAINGTSQTNETFYSSTDGRNWTATGASIANIGGGGLAVMPDGSIRFYVGAPGINGGSGGVSDFISHDDGQTWIGEPGLCVVTPSNAGLPSVWQAAPGLYDMVFQTIIDPTKPNVPSNQELTFATSTDGRNFTITQPNFLVQASSADGITPLALSPQPLASTADFNNDGNSDILWRNSDAPPAIWLMNGTMVGGMVALPEPPSSWRIVGTADFNGDGKADILWQNTDGTPGIWLMNGTLISSSAALPAVPPSWHIVGTADFNGDGKADVLWQNTDGTPGIWLMNGTLIGGSAALPVVPPSWHIVGTADFNDDGKADILWQNTDGTPGIWEMNGTLISSSAALPAVPPSWHIVGTADFNGDGKADILWQNSDGTPGIWEMNGTLIMSTAGLPNFGPDWQLLEAGDFNGDHHSDLLFLDTATDAVQVWLMNGTQVLSTKVFGNGASAASSIGQSTGGSSSPSGTPVLSTSSIQKDVVAQEPADEPLGAAPGGALAIFPAVQPSMGIIAHAS